MKTTLRQFLDSSVSPFHARETVKSILKENGFRELPSEERWSLSPDSAYFVSKAGGALVAFRTPKEDALSFQLASAHLDSPCFLIKDTKREGAYTRLGVEKYGSMRDTTFLDRPLSLAGRVMVVYNGGVEERLFRYADTLVIPSVAPHLRKGEDTALDVKKDLLPLLSLSEASLNTVIAKAIGCEEADILSRELYLYSAERAFLWDNGSLISSPRLDDLQCAYALLDGLVLAKSNRSIPVLSLFNHEEVGSATEAGADTSWLFGILERIARALGRDDEAYRQMLANSFMISADNAHAVHPAHPDLSDGEGGRAYMNGGIVIKHSARKRYATDAFSEAVIIFLCRRLGIPYQSYFNRADMPGGTTMGPVLIKSVSVPTVDLGLAQLSMHSALETAGVKDTEYLSSFMSEYFSSMLTKNEETYRLEKQ